MLASPTKRRETIPQQPDPTVHGIHLTCPQGVVWRRETPLRVRSICHQAEGTLVPEWEFQSDEETTRMNNQTFSCAAMALLLLGATCGTMASAEKERKTATAGIKDGKGQNAGQAKFTATKGGVQMSVTVTNLSPGVHAIHIHEAGKCAAPGFTTAGGHFNPANKQHGMQNPEGHHAGDLPNLTVGANGKGAFKSTIQNVIGYDLVSSSDSRGERHIEVSS